MPVPQQDFIKGVDMTGINPVTAGDLNQLIELATIYANHGLVINTVDTALDTPDVPDVAGTPKWAGYLWIRFPFPGAIASPQAYVWDDNFHLGLPPLNKWRSLIVDISTLQANITAATLTANNALAASVGANAQANAATVAANQAASNASDANTTAGNALAAATAAQTTATNALNTANQANDVSGKYVKLSETTNKGVNGNLISNVTAAITKYTRVLNTVDNNQGALVSLNVGSGVITFNVAGIYRIRATATVYSNASGGDTLASQLLVVKDSDNSTQITGSSQFNPSVGMTTHAFVEGEYTAALGDTIRLDHYTKSSNTNSNVLAGKACNIHPDAGGKEVYCVIELTKLN